MRSPRLVYQMIFSVVLLGAGAAWTHWLSVPVYRKAQASGDWPTAPGVIESSEVEDEFDSNEVRYAASVEFSYELDGVRHVSKHITPSGVSSSKSRHPAQETVDRYPEGKAVTVYYDPQKPEFGVLEPGVNAANYALLVAGGAIFAGGLALGLAGVWQAWAGRRKDLVTDTKP